MTRLTLALIAILVLALSAGLNRAPPSAPQASSLQALKPQQMLSPEFDLARTGQQGQTPALRAVEDAPVPALIAYLALVLIGSIVAVGVVRRNERQEG